jgi:hypothetical protein
MARPKKDQTNTTSVVEQTEKTTEVEQTENATTENKSVVADEKPVETPDTKPVETNDNKAKEKPIKDDDKIIIKCAAYAGKSIVLPTRTISLDEKGCCEVTGIEAKRLLTIPGYERA